MTRGGAGEGPERLRVAFAEVLYGQNEGLNSVSSHVVEGLLDLTRGGERREGERSTEGRKVSSCSEIFVGSRGLLCTSSRSF